MTQDNQTADAVIDAATKIDESAAETSQSEEKTPEECLQAQLQEMKDRWLRAEAETENVKKRLVKEKEDGLKYANSAFAKELLSLADNFTRAFEYAPQDPEATLKSFVDGIRLVESDLQKVFQQFFIHPINPLGEKFNPHLHQAMFEVETLENEAGTVVQVLQPGYQMHDRLLRPALVGIAKSVKS